MENIVAKEEIAHLEQFLLLSLCFQKAVCCRGVKSVDMRARGKTHLETYLESKQDLSEDSVLDLFVLANKRNLFGVRIHNQVLYHIIYRQSTL